jgi:hypothetical protein
MKETKYQLFRISPSDYILRYEKQQIFSQFCATKLSIAEQDKSHYVQARLISREFKETAPHTVFRVDDTGVSEFFRNVGI